MRLFSVKVRGAPAIAVVGVLSLVAEIYNHQFISIEEFCEYIGKRLDYLVSARPTAVNMADSRVKLLNQLRVWQQETTVTVQDIKARYKLMINIRIPIVKFSVVSASGIDLPV